MNHQAMQTILLAVFAIPAAILLFSGTRVRFGIAALLGVAVGWAWHGVSTGILWLPWNYPMTPITWAIIGVALCVAGALMYLLRRSGLPLRPSDGSSRVVVVGAGLAVAAGFLACGITTGQFWGQAAVYALLAVAGRFAPGVARLVLIAMLAVDVASPRFTDVWVLGVEQPFGQGRPGLALAVSAVLVCALVVLAITGEDASLAHVWQRMRARAANTNG